MVPHWFALDPSRPLFAFAGIWRPGTGTRGTKAAPEEGEHRLFSFLTTEPNDVVRLDFRASFGSGFAAGLALGEATARAATGSAACPGS